MPHLPDNASTGVFDLELIHLDLRYEGYRLPHPGLEATLLASIAREGIREPLRGVTCQQVPIVLDGFKRCRCARQLHLHVVPFASWGSDEVVGIFELLRAARPHSLSMLEEARFVDRLHAERGLTASEIAEQLGRSQAWVSLRLGLLKELSPVMSEALFTGAFPVYSYLYTLRPLRRLKGVSGVDLDQFVRALGGQKLSVRQIQGLAHGFFRGPEPFREQVLQGHLTLALRQLEEAPRDADGCNEVERVFLHDLEQARKFLGRIVTKGHDPKLHSPAFQAQCNLLTADLLGGAPAFFRTVRHLHDRSGKA